MVADAEISISGHGLYGGCERAATALHNMRVACRITPSISVVCDDAGACRVEHGCVVRLNGVGAHRYPEIWRTLQGEFALTCAHIHVEGGFRGCFHEFIAKHRP